MNNIELIVRPRETLSWQGFVEKTPRGSIALDGYVLGGPRVDLKTGHYNFDHHDGVVREATMSTAKQVLYAIKGDMMRYIGGTVHVYANDCDPDVATAVWLLKNYKLYEGASGQVPINRLIELNDRLDITGGAYPMNLTDEITETHNWVFAPYNDFLVCGDLYKSSASTMEANLEATLGRITELMKGCAKKLPLASEYEVLYDSPMGFKMVHETAGMGARYTLFAKGMNAFINRKAVRDDGTSVWTIGRRSQYIPFPILELYDQYNTKEKLLDSPDRWNGSNIVGGSPRAKGTTLTINQLAECAEDYLREYNIRL
jgi:hypothetical protein